MKLRIAKKIIEAVTDEHGNPTGRNNETQLQRANYRWNQCKSAKRTNMLMLTLLKAAKDMREPTPPLSR